MRIVRLRSCGKWSVPRLLARGLQPFQEISGGIPVARWNGSDTFTQFELAGLVMGHKENSSSPPWWQVVAVGRNPTVTFFRLLLLVAITFGVFQYVIVPIRVTGISMESTYRDGQRLYLNRLSLRMHPPQRGDILGIQMSGSSVLLLKRVIGLPGERVAIRKGQVYINGDSLDEPYLNQPVTPWNYPTHGGERVLEANKYLMIGDNRTMPQDLHEWGLIDGDRLVGRLRR